MSVLVEESISGSIHTAPESVGLLILDQSFNTVIPFPTPHVSLVAPEPPAEIGENLGSITITARLRDQELSPLPIVVHLGFAGSAQGPGNEPGDDFQVDANAITIPPFQVEGSIALTANPDLLFEGNETVVISISDVENGVPDDQGPQQIQITILDDDDPPVVSFVATQVSQTEGASGTSTPVEIAVTLTGAHEVSIAVVVEVDEDNTTASDSSDYTLTGPVQLEWSPGETGAPTNGPAILTVHGDDLDEDDEHVVLTLRDPSGTVVISPPGTMTVTILDDDPMPEVSIAGPGQVVEPDEGHVAVDFEVTLSAASGRAVTVAFAVSEQSTATVCPEGCDAAQQTTPPLVFEAGDVSRQISFHVNHDGEEEGAETLVVQLSSPVNAVLGASASATLTIVDDDPIPVVSMAESGVVVLEGEVSPQIRVDLSPAASTPVTVEWRTVDGSAMAADGDYVHASGQLMIDPQSPIGWIPGVATLPDATVESLESFTVILENPDNATLGAASFTITIRDPAATHVLEGVAPGEVVPGVELRAYSESLVAAMACQEVAQVKLRAGAVTVTLSGDDVVDGDGFVRFFARDELGLDLSPGVYQVSVGVEGEGDLFSDPVQIEVVPAGDDVPISVNTVDTDVCTGWDETRPIVPGQTVQGTWEDGAACAEPTTDTDYFTFVAGQGSRASIWVDRDPDLTIGPLHPDSTAPELLLVRPDGVVFAAATPTSLDSARASVDVELPMDGRYVIGARTSRSSGAFVLHVEVESVADGVVPRFGYTRDRAHLVAGEGLSAWLGRAVVDRFGAPVSGMAVIWEPGTLANGQFTPDGFGEVSDTTDVDGWTFHQAEPPVGGAVQSWRARLDGGAVAKRSWIPPGSTPFLGYVQLGDSFVEGATLPSAAEALAAEATWRRSATPSGGAAKSLDACDVGAETCSEDVVFAVAALDLGGGQLLTARIWWEDGAAMPVSHLDDPGLTVLSTVDGLTLKGEVLTTEGTVSLTGAVAAITAVGDHGNRVMPSQGEVCSRANVPIGGPLGYRVGRSAGFSDPLAPTWLEREVLVGRVELTYNMGRGYLATDVRVTPRPGEACEVRSLLGDLAPGADGVVVPVFPWNIGYLNYNAGQMYAADVCGNIQVGLAPSNFLSQVSSSMSPPPTLRVEPSGDGFSHGLTLMCSQTGLQQAPHATTSVELTLAPGVSTCTSPGTLQLDIHTESGAPSVGLWWDTPRPVPGGNPENGLISPEATLRDLETGEAAVWRLIAVNNDTSLDVVFVAAGHEWIPGGGGDGVPVTAYVARRALRIEPDGTVGRGFLEPVPGVELCTGLVERKSTAQGHVNWNSEVRVSCDTILATPTAPGELHAFADVDYYAAYEPDSWVDVGIGIGISRGPSEPGDYYLVVEPLESEYRRGESWRLPLQWEAADEYVRFAVGGGVFLDEEYGPISEPAEIPGRRTVFLEARINSAEPQVATEMIYESDGQVLGSTMAVLDRVGGSGLYGQALFIGQIDLALDLDIGTDNRRGSARESIHKSATAIGVGTSGVLISRLGIFELARLRLHTNLEFRVFLDVNRDNSFTPYQTAQLSTLDDTPQYLPCSDPVTRMGVDPSNLPQRMNVVAAFAVVSDDRATIVAPPSAAGCVQFELRDVSAFEGVASNWGSGTEPDFALWSGSSATASISVPFDDQSHVAVTELQCGDYGGFGELRASVGGSSFAIKLPERSDGSVLPESGWVTSTGTVVTNFGLSSDEDEDNAPAVAGPPSDGLVGDGLSNYEEYRGFIVRGEHRRTNPFKRDLFVSSNAYTNIAFLSNIPLTVHRIWGEDNEPAHVREYGPDRQINFNYFNHGFGGSIPGWSLQRAIRGMEVATSPTTPPCSGGCYGYSHFISGGPANPNDSDRFEVYRNTHQFLLTLTPPYTQEQVDNEFRRTFGHEAGHLVHICHRIVGAPSACPDGAPVGTEDSIMTTDLFNGPDASDPASQYNAADIDQIRLHGNP